MERKEIIRERYLLSQRIDEMNKIRYEEDCRESELINKEIAKAKFKYKLLKAILEGVNRNEIKIK